MSHPAIRANLLHLSYNMWAEPGDPRPIGKTEHIIARPYLRFDQTLWDDLLKRMVAGGLNMVILDVGDGVQFQSHPQISVQHAWSREKLRTELHKARDMGIELIPKLNFSTAHDAWLKEFSRMVSTPVYYQVVRDLIHETIDLFEKPRLFHLGMDEETAGHQRHYQHAILRQHDLWWHDLEWMLESVRQGGARPWIWSDYIWNHPEAFVQRMNKDVLQSNWYYGEQFDNFPSDGSRGLHLHAYDLLEQHGFDQVPTGSNWSFPTNMADTVKYCDHVIAQERLAGYMTAPWHITLETFRDEHMAAVDQLVEATT